MSTPEHQPNQEPPRKDVLIEVSMDDGATLCFDPDATILHFFPKASILNHIQVLLPEDRTDSDGNELAVLFFEHHALLGELASTGYFTRTTHDGTLADNPDTFEHYMEFQRGCLDADLEQL